MGFLAESAMEKSPKFSEFLAPRARNYSSDLIEFKGAIMVRTCYIRIQSLEVICNRSASGDGKVRAVDFVGLSACLSRLVHKRENKIDVRSL